MQIGFIWLSVGSTTSSFECSQDSWGCTKGGEFLDELVDCHFPRGCVQCFYFFSLWGVSVIERFAQNKILIVERLNFQRRYLYISLKNKLKISDSYTSHLPEVSSQYPIM